MAEKQLIVVVERTVAMGPYWENILMNYLQKMIRSFGGNESTEQKPYTSAVEFALVTFCNHGCHSGCLVQRSGWTRDPDVFFGWLSAIPFSGGRFNDAAFAEGLSEALMMFCNSQSGGQNQQNVDLQKHCILVAASNPYPLPTPVYVPRPQNLAQSETIEADLGNHLFDAEAVAKAFPELSVSLSVICPNQLTKVRAIYNVAKRNSRSSDPPIDTESTPFLILISESLREACSALSCSGITRLQPNESPVKVESVSAPPINGAPQTSMPSVNGSITNWQPISTVNVALATVKLEPGLVTSTVSGPAYPQISSVPCAATQAVPSLQTSSPSSAYQDVMIKKENAQDLKPIVTMPPPLCTMGPAQANVGQNSSLGSLTLATSDVNNAAAAPNMSLPQQTSGATQSARSKYAKVWEGNLCGLRHGQPKYITRLECYRKASAPETLSANWPSTMQIDRLISQDHMNNRRFGVEADFLVFRALSVHGFLGQMQEKKLCAVIQLSSRTLLLSVSDKVGRLIGMLLPANTIAFKPRLSTQQQQQHQQMQSQQQQHLLQLQQQQWQLAQLQLQEPPQYQQQPLSQSQLQHQQQFPQQQQMVGAGMGQGYVQGPGWSQLVFQGQFSSQGNPNTGGGGFMG